jgi:XTP/dITP diphosphohydrolase
MEIVLATRNDGKIAELHSLMKGFDVTLSSLRDHPQIHDIVEDGATFFENARKKARCVAAATGKFALADDSGLEVEALGGAPGVMSARYAGGGHDYKANNEKLILEMEGVADGKRAARFFCAMVLAAPDGREWTAEGECRGEIAMAASGTMGFGYDPLFYIPRLGKTMAELPMDIKNRISHRGRALAAMREILIEILGENKEL